MRHISFEKAQEIHDSLLIVDGHNDTLVERVARGEMSLNWKHYDPAYHIDIPRMVRGGFNAGFFVVGNGPKANLRITIERTLAQIDTFPKDLLLVHCSKDIQQAQETGKIGILMTIEGSANWLEGELDALRLYYRLGVRCLGLTHGEGGINTDLIHLQGSKSPFGLCTPEEREYERKNASGLTRFGRDVLKASNEIGLVTDLAHINDKAFYEVIEHTSVPVAMTHTAAFSLCHHWRCLTDDQIKALAKIGGVVGIAFVPFFIHPENATIDRIADHICYIADLVGIEHVAIGSDFDGMGSITPVVPDVSQLVYLTHSLLTRGLSKKDIQKVWGENFLRLLEQTIDG